MAAAGTVVREVTRMRGAAEAAGQRLLTLTIEAELGFEQPQDFEEFSQALAAAIAGVAERYRPGRQGVTISCWGRIRRPPDQEQADQLGGSRDGQGG